MTIPNAAAAFRTTGIYPFNLSVIQTTDSVKRLSETSFLHYIPLMSPMPSRKSSSGQFNVDIPPFDGSFTDGSGNDTIQSNLLLNDVLQQQSVISRFFPDTCPHVQPPAFY